MRALLILNLLLLAAAATMALVLGVVCILYWANLDASPRMARELPGLLALTGMFTLLTLSGGGAVAAWRWMPRWRWPGQLVFAGTLILVALYVWEFMQ